MTGIDVTDPADSLEAARAAVTETNDRFQGLVRRKPKRLEARVAWSQDVVTAQTAATTALVEYLEALTAAGTATPEQAESITARAREILRESEQLRDEIAAAVQRAAQRPAKAELPVVSLEQVEAALTSAGLSDSIRWRVRISKRRTGTGRITIEPDTSVVITVPERCDPAEVARLVKSRTDTIIATVLKARQSAPDHPAKELISGEGFDLLGRPYRLRVADNFGPVRIDRVTTPNGSFPFLFLDRSDAATATALIDWYTRQGDTWIGEHAPAWTSRLSATGLKFTIEDLGERPAAFRPASRTVALHWALFALDRDVVEFTLVRHAARLRNGQVATPAAADASVESLIPDWRSRVERLRAQWRTAWTGAISQTETTQTRRPGQ